MDHPCHGTGDDALPLLCVTRAGERPHHHAGVDRHRRAVLKGVVAGGVAVWVAPGVSTLSAAGAQAGTPAPPRQCPTAAEMLASAVVTAAIEQAWTDSQPDDAANRHEEGGWIIHNHQTGGFRIVRVAAGERAGIDPGAPPALNANEQICGFFHTHPNPEVDDRPGMGHIRWAQGPSDADTRWHTNHTFPGIIRNRAGNQGFGPLRGPYT